jgi:hypothetical protein
MVMDPRIRSLFLEMIGECLNRYNWLLDQFPPDVEEMPKAPEAELLIRSGLCFTFLSVCLSRKLDTRDIDKVDDILDNILPIVRPRLTEYSFIEGPRSVRPTYYMGETTYIYVKEGILSRRQLCLDIIRYVHDNVPIEHPPYTAAG